MSYIYVSFDRKRYFSSLLSEILSRIVSEMITFFLSVSLSHSRPNRLHTLFFFYFYRKKFNFFSRLKFQRSISGRSICTHRFYSRMRSELHTEIIVRQVYQTSLEWIKLRAVVSRMEDLVITSAKTDFTLMWRVPRRMRVNFTLQKTPHRLMGIPLRGLFPRKRRVVSTNKDLSLDSTESTQ